MKKENPGIMSRSFNLATLVSLFICFPASADDPEDAGKRMAEKLCARCHAIGATGESPFEPAPPFRQIVTKWNVDSLAEAFAEGIVVGHPDMPEFQFEPEQIEELLSYMRTLESE